MLPDDVAKQGCDVCGEPATRWFRQTCAIVCDDNKCYDTQEDSWQQAIKEDEELRKFWE